MENFPSSGSRLPFFPSHLRSSSSALVSASPRLASLPRLSAHGSNTSAVHVLTPGPANCLAASLILPLLHAPCCACLALAGRVIPLIYRSCTRPVKSCSSVSCAVYQTICHSRRLISLSPTFPLIIIQFILPFPRVNYYHTVEFPYISILLKCIVLYMLLFCILDHLLRIFYTVSH